MPRIVLPVDVNVLSWNSSAIRQKPLNLTPSDWHAAVAGGAPLNVAAGFSDPSSAYADRIPEVTIAGGGADTAITLVGTWNSAAQTETKTCTAGATTKFDKPFDTITAMTSTTDPVANTTLRVGDSYADPPARWLWVDGAGDVRLQLSSDTTLSTLAAVAAGLKPWRAKRVAHTTTTATGLLFLW